MLALECLSISYFMAGINAFFLKNHCIFIMTILLSPSLTERRGVSLPMMSQPGGFGSIRFLFVKRLSSKMGEK